MTYATQPAPVTTRSRSVTRGRDRHPADPSSYLVPPAMLVVAVAMGVASNLHLGLSIDMAIAVGAALFCAMLLCHVLLRAADMADRAEEEAEERRVAKVDSPMPIAVTEVPAAPPAFVQKPLSPQQPTYPAEAAEFGRGLGALAAQDVQATAAITAAAEPTEQVIPTVAVFAPVEAAPGMVQPAMVQPAMVQVVPAFVTPIEPDVPGQRINPAAWNFRPVDLRSPADDMPARSTEAVSSADASAMVAAIGALRPTVEDRPTSVPADTIIETNEIDRIDIILKRLAQQIKAGTSPSDGPAVASDPVAAAPPLPKDSESLAEGAADKPDAALASAVDALRSTVEAMRHGSAQPVSASAAPASPVEARIAAVAEALAVERVDVVLAPILAIAGAEARHFEVSVRLRDPAGELLDARATAGGAGLLPLLDAMNVRHAAGFALKLERRGRDGAVFSDVAGESLESDGFVGDVAGRYAQGIADRMVLSFAQGEMRGLGPAHFAAIGDLARLGFRFAITGVADLDMDFETLKALGFQFVKLEAAVFLGGLPCSSEVVPASDLCRHFQDIGIEVIVSGIDDQERRDHLLGCGVTLGQGALYGEPRPIPFADAAAAA